MKFRLLSLLWIRALFSTSLVYRFKPRRIYLYTYVLEGLLSQLRALRISLPVLIVFEPIPELYLHLIASSATY